jgi:anti-sigma B factor antagonist
MLEQQVHGEVTVLTPHKDLMGGKETRELDAAIREIITKGPPAIVVDLGRISFVNSTGLGALIAAHVSCQKNGGWLRVARTSKRIKNLFLVTRLNFVLDTYDTVEEALAARPREQA